MYCFTAGRTGEHTSGDVTGRRRVFSEAERVQDLVDECRDYVIGLTQLDLLELIDADVDDAAAGCSERHGALVAGEGAGAVEEDE